MKKLCSTIADALNRQRGNQYGFGDDPYVTHTKPIKNHFDRELEKTEAEGFAEATDDLIKYSRDLIGDDHKWRTKEVRKKKLLN